MPHNWTPQQKAALKEFAEGDENIVLDARAGSAKTTTMIEGIARAPERRILACAFNKIIAQELQQRLRNPQAEARTFHSIGNRIISQHYGRCKVDTRRGTDLARQSLDRTAPFEAVRAVAKLAALGKNIVPFCEDPADLAEIAARFAIEDVIKIQGTKTQHYSVEDISCAALKAMKSALDLQAKVIDYDDMLYVPLVNGWVRPQYGLVVVDEVQDMNPVQIEIAKRICVGRFIAVGDPFQCIYGFRGADSNIMDILEKEMSAKRMKLTVSFRCPQVVARDTKRLVSEFEAAPANPAGEILHADDDSEIYRSAAPSDFVVSRKNAPLSRICLGLLKRGKKAIIRGRDIAQNLDRIIREAGGRNIPEMLENLQAWQDRMVEQAIAKDASERQIDAIYDQVETIEALCEGLASVDELKKRLETLFSNNCIGSAIVCSTVHKAKGLETDRVFLLDYTLYPGKSSENDQEERNIEYVAMTRTKQTLVRIERECEE